MPDEPQWSLSSIPKFVSAWLPAVSVFSLILGVVYQTAYWSQFDVNVLSYMGLQDVIRVSITPLAIIGVTTFAAATMIVISVLVEKRREAAAPRPPPPRWKRLVVGLVRDVIVVAIVLLVIWNARVSTMIASFLVGFLLAMATQSSLFPHIQPAFARILLISTLIVAPVYSWVLGFERADRLQAGQEFNLATLPSSVLSSIPNGDVGTQPYYLGHVNDYDFFRSGKRTVVFRSQALPTFSYEFHENTKLIRLPFRDPLLPEHRK